MKCFVFVEDGVQVDLALEKIEGDDFQWVALSPRAMWELESRNIEYKILGQYAFFEELDREELRIVEKLKPCYYHTGQFAELRRKYPELILDLNGYFFARSIVQIEINLYRLKAFLEAERPDEIVCFDSGEKEQEKARDYKVPDLFARCLRLLAEKMHIPLREFICKPPLEKSFTNKKDKSADSSHLYSIVRLLRSIAHRLVTPRAAGDRRILLLSLAYDLEFLAHRLVKTGKYPVYLYNCTSRPDIDQEPEVLNGPEEPKAEEQNPAKPDQVSLERMVESFWEKLKNDSWFRNFFSWEGIYYGKEMEDRLKIVFWHGIYTINLYYPKHVEMLERYKITQILSPYPKVNPIATSLWYAAAKLGIPITVYQHGGCYGYMFINQTRLLDYHAQDCFLSYGKGLKEQLHWSNVEFDNFFPVGSLKLSISRRRPPGNAAKLRSDLLGKKYRKIVTYAVNLFRPIWANPNHIDSSTVTYNFQKRLVSLFNDFPDILLVIKLHHSDRDYNPIEQFLAAGNFPNCTVRQKPMFMEYIKASDLVIIDYPGTAFIEALSLGMPICAFSSGFRIYPEIKQEFKRCMLYEDDMDLFFERLSEKLEKLSRGEGELVGEMDSRIRESFLIDDDRVPERLDKMLEYLITLKERGLEPEKISFEKFDAQNTTSL
ncbi:MAG TPA: hypothetical protein VM123_07190 [archaeon]|nr:hypothetical protein [archaeon]